MAIANSASGRKSEIDNQQSTTNQQSAISNQQI
jgi:hypothetical protein